MRARAWLPAFASIQGKIVIKLLSDYIAIDTSYPTYHYDAAIALFMQHAQKAGLVTQRILLSSGYPAAIVTLQGRDSSLPALALNHHMDVVPASLHDGWISDPFKATIIDDQIIGRGTQDMKGVGVSHLAALCSFKEQYGAPNRTVHLLMVPHEEHGGFAGTACLLDHPAFAALTIGFVLDEGMPSGDETALLIKIADKAPVQIRITAHGKTAHGACMAAHNPIYELVNALHEFAEKHRAQQELCATHNAGLLVSYQCTALSAGSLTTHNQIPAQASATLDIRVPPGKSFEPIIEEISALCAARTGMTYEILAQGIPSLPAVRNDNSLYQALAAVIQAQGMIAKDHYFEASSDARFYTKRGIIALGFTPFTSSANLHGVNESISIADLERGKHSIVSLLEKFCKE